ncbi:MAG: undecaprenyl/decaprenyl-phosphate alpha-N-acetylglucosaminyl 1-phosphate transferase, partial [Actinobacteria bacterium]|nr:undecaprenyl/decaprenyl-phosphate alpha-N-acetylglucosaminyl 1-phosphate transferase [Actinomycetota bacterium]
MRTYLLVMVIAAAVTFLTTPVARSLAQAVHAVTPVRARDVHSLPTARLGGVAMLAGLVVALVVASRIPYLAPVFSQSG